MYNTTIFNLMKLFIISAVIIIGLWYLNNLNNLKNTKKEGFDNTTIPATTIANILPPIKDAINSGYNAFNVNRFATIDNQIRLDKLNTRVNKLLSDIQKSYNLTNKDNANQMTFY